ncbi:MAG: TIGR03086 family metal-binding protein [Acidimicrobiales bacterium]
MSADTSQLPVFPTNAPAVFADPVAVKALFASVLSQLAQVVEVSNDQLGGPTPCRSYTVADLRRHVLAWLQFFAAALDDPAGATERLDPDAWELAPGQRPADIIGHAAADIERAVDAGASGALVVMSQARMAVGGVLAMALGEYLVHGWDLAVSTGRTWSAGEDAAEAALAFLRTTVAPEHRGPDSGFFDEETPASPGATAFERLLCFTGRRPDWTPAG